MSATRVDEIHGHQLHRRHIDAHDDFARQPLPPPLRELRAGRAQHPAAELTGEVGGLGDSDERAGREQTAGRVHPADQRLHGQDPAGAQIDLGLVVQDQRTASMPHCAGSVPRRRGVRSSRHASVNSADAVAAAGFGRQQGMVGAPQQIRRCVSPGIPTATPMLTARLTNSRRW